MKHIMYRNSIIIFSLLVLLSSCAGPKRKSGSELDGEIQGQVIQEPTVNSESLPGEVYGPSAPAGPAAPSEAQDQNPISPGVVEAPKEAPKMCLILSPGMAKAIAHAAVLEAISKAKLPVHCVVGSETGALVGALYSLAKGNTNSLQWQLFKLNKDNYFNFPVLSLREPKSSGKKLNEYFVALFKGKKIEDLPIRFGTVIHEEGASELTPIDKGLVAESLSAAVALPDIFDPWKVQGKKFFSGAVENPAPFDLAKSLGGNFFVFINVLDEGTGADGRFQKAFSGIRALAKQQSRDASFVIPVRLGNIGFDEFGRQGEILAAGQRAAEESVENLKLSWEKWVAEQQN